MPIKCFGGIPLGTTLPAVLLTSQLQDLHHCLLALCLVLGFALSAQIGPGGPIAAATAEEAYRSSFTMEEEQAIHQRLAAMESIIGKHHHPVVESYIRGYMLRNRDKAEAILGRIPTYFPLFEEELRKAGLPDDLKYLAIVESALDPRALSRSGAGGLWQFMPGTGQMFGLTINRTVDERGDVEKATKAAVEFLRQEYQRFGDWALVLAAYNGGPGRVRRAIRRSGKTNFWEIRRYLPRETRNYVPAFVAAMYLHKYGDQHQLRARPLTLDEQFPVGVACPFGVSLVEVAQATEVPLEVIKSMNRHCLNDYVPAGVGATCRVPARVAESLATYLDWRVAGSAPDLVTAVQARAVVVDTILDSRHFYQLRKVVMPAKTSLESFARSHDVSRHHLEMWNPYLTPYASFDQELQVYQPHFVPNSPFASRPKLKIASLQKPDLVPLPLAPQVVDMRVLPRAPNATYRLRRYESLLDVYQRFAADMSWEEFAAWNQLNEKHPVQPGSELHIRKVATKKGQREAL